MTPTEALQIRNALKKDSSAKGFLFFSDNHNNSNTLGRIIQTARDWGSTYIDAIINAGDFLGSWYGDPSFAAYKTALDGLIGDNPLGIDVLHALGNHDCWKDYYHWWMSLSELETIYGSWAADYASSYGDAAPVMPSGNDDSIYYYKDYGSVRVILLNAVHADASQSKLDGEPYTGDIYWDATQKSWLEGVLASAKTNNMHVLLVNHYMPNKTVLFEKTNMTMKEFKKVNENNPWAGASIIQPTSVFDEGWMPSEVLEVVKDFIDAGGIFVGWLGGHLHIDKLWGVKASLEETYGKQILFQTGTSGLESDLDATGNTHDLYNYVVVNTSKKIMTVVRLGLGWDALGNERRIFTWDYDNKVYLRYK